MSTSSSNAPREITQLLQALSDGQTSALDDLMPLVYDELRRIARHRLRSERDTHTLQTTDLVHEAYERLVDHHAVDWNDRSHFFSVAARAMRQVLVDHARRKHAQKRGGNAPHIAIEEATIEGTSPAQSLLAINDALEQLEARAPRQGKVVESRFFAGMTIKQTAHMLDVSPSTVKRDWRAARAWLARALE
ncbi:MAG: sigma-70 family RNA polymerase sigma factor [Salinibacter sp.]